MRKQIINDLLKLPFNLIVDKYDYWIEGKVSYTFNTLSKIKHIRYLSDNDIVIHNDYLSLYNLKTKKYKIFDDSNDIEIVEILFDKRIITYGNRYLKIWDQNGLQRSLKINPICNIIVLKNNKVALYGYGNTLIWDLDECFVELKKHNGAVLCVCLLQNDKLVTGSLDVTIKIWNFAGICESTLIGCERINNIHSWNNLIIGCTWDAIRIWDDKECQKIITSYYINKMIIYNDKAICLDTYHQIKIWNLVTGICEVELKDSYVGNIILLPNNQLLGAAWTGNKIWDLTTYELIHRWNGYHQSKFTTVLSLSVDEKIVNAYENELVIWN